MADFPLQTNWVFGIKRQGLSGLLLHAAIHSVVTAILLQGWRAYMPLLVTLGAVHFVTDWLKLNMQYERESVGFLIDQAAHLLCVVALGLWPWSTDTRTSLPPVLLYPAVMYALGPAILMYLSVRAGELQHRAQGDVAHAARLKSLSQAMGFPLVVIMIIWYGWRAVVA